MPSFSSSDAGGVGAKKGFLFQDHIAARYLIELLHGSRIQAVHCESRDDISLEASDDGKNYWLHIQVKTTDKDKKWNLTEFNESQIYPKQLDLDRETLPSFFQIVTSRDVGSSPIKYLIHPIENRNDPELRGRLIRSLSKYTKRKNSANGNGAEYYVDRCFWEVVREKDAIIHQNLRHLYEACEFHGYTLYKRQLDILYDWVVQRAVDASAESNVTSPDQKKIERKAFIDMFASQLKVVFKDGSNINYPYAKGIDNFLIHHFHEKEKNKQGEGLDVGIDLEMWRVKEFSDYLYDQLIEFALPASDLSALATSPTKLITKFNKSLTRIRKRYGHDLTDVLGG